MSVKGEQAKEVKGPISFFTTFAIFTNSTPASLVLTVKQNNATEVYFSESKSLFFTLKETKDKTKKLQ